MAVGFRYGGVWGLGFGVWWFWWLVCFFLGDQKVLVDTRVRHIVES